MREFIEKCIAAVAAEIAVAKNGGNSTRSIRVVNGTYLRPADKSQVYRFVATSSLPVTYEDAPVVLLVEGHQIGGSVIGMHDCDVTLAVDEYLGKYVAEAQLVIDLTFILERLKEALTEKTSTLATCAIARKAVGKDKANVSEGRLKYIRGQKPMHHKLAILRFPAGGKVPIVWKGSMNALGHYNSEELMDRSQSQDLFECVSRILKLDQLQSALRAREMRTKLEKVLRAQLGAVCFTHKVPMLLRYGRNARYPSFFMSCPNWQDGCGTVSVDVDILNAALRTIGATCTRDSCDAEISAGRGRNGIYLKCREGHFVNLD